MISILPEIQTFAYGKQDIRIVVLDGDPWFVAKDTCDILGLEQVSRAISRLDDDEVTTSKVTDSLGREQVTSVVNESGLYSLILTSRKQAAKTFKRWITHEVIPSIRKTGGYSANQMLDERQVRVELFRTAIDHEERVSGLEHRVEAVERSTTLDHGEQERVRKAVAKKVCSMTEDQSVKREYFRQLHKEIKSRWAVASYRDVLRVEMDEVLKYIDAWRPRIV